MKYRLSTGMTLGLVFVVVVGLSHWLAYQVSKDLLQIAVHEREIDRVKTVGRVLQGLIAQQTQRVSEIARQLAAQDSLAAALARQEPQRTAAVEPVLNRAFASSRLGLLEVTDEHETILYRAHAPGRRGDRATDWGVAEALAGTAMLSSSTTSDGVAIRAIEPVQSDKKILGTISAGVVLDQRLLKALSDELGADLALLPRNGSAIMALPSLAASVDAKAVVEAFHQKIPIYREDPVARHTRVYLPVLIVDEAFVILAQIDSAGAYALLDRSAVKSAGYALLILAVSILLLAVTLRLVLKPLRRLRARAQQTAIELTGQPILDESRDEIASVVQVLDALTQRLVTHNRDLAHAKAAADAASEAKSQFLSNMSHEIRTPLNGVLGMAELLQGTPLNDEQTRYVHSIAAAGRTLHDLLSDILDLAKIEAGKIRTETLDFSLAALLADLAAIYRELASARGSVLVAEVDPALPIWARGDPTRLRQVLSNLLGNAVKFTERGSINLKAVQITAPNTDGRFNLRITVSDTGIGIPSDSLKNLFKPFSQADTSTTRRFGGTGLGLVICKNLVELMGGTIDVDSTLAQGSSFWIELPLGVANAPASAAGSAPAGSLRPSGAVLVAEDNVVNQQVVRAMLVRLGMTATIVENGAAAIEMLRKGKFDLVLMDCQMPVLDGYAATEQIRAAEGGREHIPIIALTANALAEDRRRCTAAGMDDYLAKPVSLAALTQALARWLPAQREAALDAAAPASNREPPAPPEPLSAAILDALVDQIGSAAVAAAMKMFLDMVPKHRQSLASCETKRDLAALAASLHSLKSSSKALGATEFALLAERVEHRARVGDAAAWSQLAGINAELERFCQALSQHPLLATAPQV